MIVLKIIISASIVAVTSYIGIMKSKVYEIRLRELKRIKNALSFFKSKIEFTYEPIKEVFENISKAIYINKDNIFLKTLKYCESFDISEAWSKAVIDDNSFNNEDKEILKMFGKLLRKNR